MEKRLRIITGIVLFVYVTMHLLNVAAGLHSITLIETLKPFLTGIWSNVVLGPLLLICLLVHLALGLAALYRRNTLNMSRSDTIQLVTGLLVIPLLVPHIVGTTIARQGFEVIPDYPVLIYYFWVTVPSEGLRQVLLLSVVWVHGATGLFTWLRLRSWWSSYGPWINPLAVIVPVLGLTGFAEAGRQALLLPGPPPISGAFPTAGILQSLANLNRWTIIIYVCILAATLAARYVRVRRESSETRITYYAEDRTVVGDTGLTLLETSRVNDIHHASLCNGRGRCGTCRVRIVSTDQPLPDPSPEEAAVLSNFRAPSNVRLACRLKPQGGNLVIERLLPPDIEPSEVKRFSMSLPTRDDDEREIAVTEPAQ